ncbi:winged helix-turn-helix domain-containing protein [Streptomyces sp. NPDC001868]|uniref:winged helix-turn-helix domain-containing protein n=1 Tax=Streptomyces sp. NPDC001868 TaxID=3154401 RepID=UPI00332C1EA5
MAKLLKRHGWSCQVPVRHAIERDEEAIEMWKDEVWPRLKGQRRTWAPRGARPVGRVRGNGRVNIAGAVCFRTGSRPHFFYRLRVHHGRKGKPKTFAWHEYRDLIITARQQLNAPLVWCWGNLNVPLAKELVAFAEEHADWLPTHTRRSVVVDRIRLEGWLHHACWLDLATREVIGYAIADHHRGELMIDALWVDHGRDA